MCWPVAEETMAPKKGGNTKAEEARERKDSQKEVKKVKEEREAEDSKWDDGGGAGGKKAAKKKEEEAERKAEAAAKKAEAKRLAAEEEKEMEKISKKGVSAKSSAAEKPKVTAAQLAQVKEKEKERLEVEAAAAKKKSTRTADEGEYARLVDVENRNKVEHLVDARSVGDALSQIAIADGDAPADKHPEKRQKAAYKAYEEAELKQLKAERPGMTLTQYKDLIWKSWKKSPQNPVNQVPS